MELLSSEYEWTVTGAQTVVPSGSSCTVTWGSVGVGTVKVKEITTGSNCESEVEICVEIINKPQAEFMIMPNYEGNTIVTICKFGEVVGVDLSNSGLGSPIVEWHWDWGDGNQTNVSAGAMNNPVKHQYLSSGIYIITLTVTNACNCTDSYTMRVRVRETPAPKIACPRVSCENETIVYNLTDYDPSMLCSSPTWNVIGGTIQTQTATSVQIKWDNVNPETGFGYISYTTCGPCPMTMVEPIPVVLKTSTIQGYTDICQGEQYIYRLPKWPGTDFNWGVNSNIVSLSNTDQPNEIIVHANASGTVTLKVEYCNTVMRCGGIAEIVINIKPRPGLNGSEKLCINDNVNYALGAGLPGDWILTDPYNAVTNWTNTASINHTFNIVGIYTLTAGGNNYCSSEQINIIVHDIPSPPQYLDGLENVCPGLPFEYTVGTKQSGTYFDWNVSPNATIKPHKENSCMIKFAPPLPQTISVRRVIDGLAHCASSSLDKVIQGPIPLFSIAGKNNVCHSTIEEYSIPYAGADHYSWEIYPYTLGSVTENMNKQNVTVTWNTPTPMQGQVGWLVVKAMKCNVLQTDTLEVFVNGKPDFHVTASSNNICAGESVNLTIVATNPLFPITNATQIDWKTDQGSVTTGFTNSYGYVFSQSITSNQAYANGSVVIHNPNGCEGTITAPMPTIFVRPSPTSYITPSGEIDLCPPNVVTLTATVGTGIGGTNTLVWSGSQTPAPPPNNPIWTGVGDAGNYFVTVTNTNGCSAQSNIVSIAHDCPSIALCGPSSNAPTIMLNGDLISCGTVSLEASYTLGTSSWHGMSWNFPSSASNIISNTIPSPATLKADMKNPGQYDFSFSIQYLNSALDTCILTQAHSIEIPYIADPKYGVVCNSLALDYEVTMFDNTSLLPNVVAGVNRQYHYATSMLGPWTSLTIAPGGLTATVTLPPGDYILRQTVSHIGYQDCVAYIEMNLPELPIASFVLANSSIHPGCEKDVVFNFINTSTPTNGLSYLWNFVNEAYNTLKDVGKVYDKSGYYDVILTSTNEYGCASTASMSIEVTKNNISPASTVSSSFPPPLPCYGDPVTLSFSNSSSLISPDQYTWHMADVPLGITYSPVDYYDIYQTNYYWVLGMDNQGCKAFALSIPVEFVVVPPVAIKASHQVCAEAPFTLSAIVAGDLLLVGATYEWERIGYGVVGTNKNIVDIINTPGNYQYRLRLSYDGCIRYSPLFDIEVLPAPLPPDLNFNVINCEPYHVRIEVVGPSAGIYNWSNAMSGSSIEVWEGGPYKVTYTSPNGCKSENTISTPKDLSGYLWMFPDGCFCNVADGSIELDPRCEFAPYIKAPQAWVNYWAWWRDGTVDEDGYNDYVTDYTLPGSGVFGLELNNGYCSVFSSNMYYSADTCQGIKLKPLTTDYTPISEQQKNFVELLPNPAHSKVKIIYYLVDSMIPETAALIELFDPLGRQILSVDLKKQKGEVELDVASYASGIYELRLVNKGHILFTTKLSIIK